jgi:L-threonylcarbamoyladenylate synthase
MIGDICSDIPSLFHSLAEKFWPGPLTLILKASPRLPSELLGEEKTVGVRIPSHEWVRAMVKEAGFPVTSTSANISGESALSDPEDVKRLFTGKVDLIIDAGPTKGSRPSTVLDLTAKRPKILREGAIPASRLHEYVDI